MTQQTTIFATKVNLAYISDREKAIIDQYRRDPEQFGLLGALASYVSGDDVALDQLTFLRTVRDRITDDLATAYDAGRPAPDVPDVHPHEVHAWEDDGGPCREIGASEDGFSTEEEVVDYAVYEDVAKDNAVRPISVAEWKAASPCERAARACGFISVSGIIFSAVTPKSLTMAFEAFAGNTIGISNNHVYTSWAECCAGEKIHVAA